MKLSSLVTKPIAWNRRCSRSLAERFPRFFSAPCHYKQLLSKITNAVESRQNGKVLEVGGIDRPMLAKGRGYAYHGVDIEANERCSELYDSFFQQSIEQPLAEKYDLVISMTVLEHVPDNTACLNNIFESLNPGGETLHYLPSKWHPYAIALRLVGPVLQKRLIPILRPGAEAVSGYPAFFDHCSVPAMSRLLKTCGFTEVETTAIFRANDYFAFCTPLYVLVSAFENLCAALKWDIFASGFIVSAKRAAQDVPSQRAA